MIKKKLIPLFIILVALALFLMPYVKADATLITENPVLTTDQKLDAVMQSVDTINAIAENTGKIDEILRKVDTANTKLSFFGTEYHTGDNGTIWLQLLRNYIPISDATCYATVYAPSKSALYSNIMLTYLSGSDGIYYYDFTVPYVVGVYMTSATCFVPSSAWIDNFNNFSYAEISNNLSIINGKAVLSFYNTTTFSNYTDETWESTLYLQHLNDTSAVDYDLGSLSNITSNIEVCFYASENNAATTTSVTNNLTRISSITLPNIAIPNAWTCINISKSLFNNGTNRIGLQCTYYCSIPSSVVIRTDTTAPDNNTYFYNITTGWLEGSYDSGIKIKYNISRQHRYGNLRSIPIVLNNTMWNMFSANYMPYDGSIAFKVLNNTNAVLCNSTGDIESCANTTTPIKLYAEFTRLTGNSSELDSWSVDWLNETSEEIKGSGEFHVSLPLSVEVNLTEIISMLVANNQSVMNKLNVIESEVLSANNTASIWFTYLNGSVVRIENNIDNITLAIGNLNLSIADLRNILLAVNQTIMNKLMIIDGKADTIILNIANNTATLVSVNKTINDRLDTVIGDLSMLGIKIDNLSINMGDYFTSINDSIWLGGGIMERMQYYFHYSMEQLDATNEKILAINQTIMNKLYLMQDDLANITYIVSHLNVNMSEVLAMLQSVNQTLYNKLVLIQGDIISVNNSVIDLNNAMVSQFDNTNGKIDLLSNKVDYINGTIHAINQTVMWWIYDIKDEIREINMTVGDLNLTVYINSTSPKEVWQYFTAMSAAEAPYVSVNGITGASVGVAHALDSMCINSTHIQRFGNTNVCYGGDCFGVGVNRTETCQYGCDMTRNECKGSPTESWFWAGLIILIFIVAIVAIWRYLS